MIIGLIGKPSCGKSTFFKAATLADIPIASYPFTTIKPNEGIAYTKIDCVDKEFNTQCTPKEGFCINHKRFIPIKLLDVAGLVPGAHQGKGLGNQFLDDLNQADALIHVLDISGTTNEKGEPVENYNPINDVKFLEYELDMWYLRILKKGWNKFSRKIQQEKQPIYKAIAKQMSGLRVTEDIAQQTLKKLNLNENIEKWTKENLLVLAIELRKQTKPMIIAANKMDLKNSAENLIKLQQEFPNYKIIPCSAESEIALREATKKELIEYIPGEETFKILKKDKLNEKQLKALQYIKENILNKYKTTGIQQTLDFAIFQILKYIAVFPGGVNNLKDSEGRIIPDCFLFPENSTALDFAYRLHQDLGKGFIRAINVKTKQTIGKDYKLKHRDIIEIIAK